MPASSERVAQVARAIIRSGVALIDDWIGGVRDGGVHLITGGTGSGKSTIALNFADAALSRGERVGMLVSARGDDVFDHAAHLGIDFSTPLRDGRLVLLRYQPEFALAVGYVPSPEQVTSDFERLLAPSRSRIVVDGLGPFIAGSLPVAATINALMRALDHLGATSLVTFTERLTGAYDRSLEPLVQRAAAVIHLDSEPGGVRTAELSTARYATPASSVLRFLIQDRPVVLTDKILRPDRRSPVRTR